jgi:exodeoxyribonuclease VII small subunit
MANQMTNQTTKETSFEKAFARLEEILDKLNSGALSLDDSLKLYEEANHLIQTCSKKLADAERRIEILLKERNGDLQMDGQGNPKKENFDI